MRVMWILFHFGALLESQVFAWGGHKKNIPDYSIKGEEWIKKLHQEYESKKEKLSFCFGDNDETIFELAKRSFPTPLLAHGPSDDVVCNNATRIAQNLCSPKEIEFYYEHLLRSNDPETVPDNPTCRAKDSASGVCSPGYFHALPDLPSTPHTCCEGYFCPAHLTCILPCPYGSYCPRAFESDPPDDFLQKGVGLHSKWCAPFGYKKRLNMSCGGADRWTATPKAAFPGYKWENGSGTIFCKGGSYCTDPLHSVECPEGTYCRGGSSETSRCPFMEDCPHGTEVPDGGAMGVCTVLFIFLLMYTMNRVYRWYNKWRLRYGYKRFYSKPRNRALWTTLAATLSGSVNLNHIDPDSGYSALPEDPASDADDIIDQEPDSSVIPLTSSRGLQTEEDLEPGRERAHSTPEIRTYRQSFLKRMAVERIDVEFQRLGLRLKGNGAVVLDGVTGKLWSSHITAIMGPSGAGKTTFLATLLGKASYGTKTGRLLVNGMESTLEDFRRIIGFVPQDDIMTRQLTVEENLRFSASFRLPSAMKASEHTYFVEHALGVLGLTEIRNSFIGDEETRGISGGQRKRVNVGLELVSNPSLLACDEPTSGLDSTASKQLLMALSNVAELGVNVTLVIHQPSFEIFESVHDLLLLGKGGRTVYSGEQSKAMPYFEQLGFQLPARCNPADFLMDVIAGLVPTSSGDLPHPQWLFSCWEEKQPSFERSAQDEDEDDSEEKPTERKFMMLFLIAWIKDMLLDMGKVLMWPCNQAMWCLKSRSSHYRSTASFFAVWLECLKRAVLKRSREPREIFLDYALFALTGSIIGLTSNPKAASDITKSVTNITNMIIGLGLLSTVSALKTFGRDRVVYWREASSGLNPLSFFVALDTFDYTGVVIKPAVFLALYYTFTQPRGDLYAYYLVTACIVYCCTGLAYLLSLTQELASAQLSAAVLALVNTLVASLDPMGITVVPYNLSYARWGMEGYIIVEARGLKGVWLLARCGVLEAAGYDVRNYNVCIGFLIGLGLFYRACAFFALIFVNRNKQK